MDLDATPPPASPFGKFRASGPNLLADMHSRGENLLGVSAFATIATNIGPAKIGYGSQQWKFSRFQLGVHIS